MQIGAPALAARDVAPDLRLIHRLRRGQAAELVDHVKEPRAAGSTATRQERA